MNDVKMHKSQASKTDVNITLTEQAIAHIRRYMAKKGHGKGLRLAVSTTGCSGLAYETQLADAPEAGDLVTQVTEDIALFVDPKALPYLQGMEIDHVREGLQERFVYNNPNQKGECGCGESFLV
jgi:iron-sulfur cluster assembly protein